MASSTPAKRTWGSPVVSVTETIRKVESNDPSLKVIDLSNSASFQGRSDEFAVQLFNALKQNSHVVDVNLVNCAISDRISESIGDALAVNKSIVVLNLEKNKLNQAGASNIAKGLSKNTKLAELNLMNQANARWGDTCLDEFLEMFQTNTTLTKIHWRLESRKSFAINKFLTRNSEIERRKKAGMNYSDLIPDSVRGPEQNISSRQSMSSITSTEHHEVEGVNNTTTYNSTPQSSLPKLSPYSRDPPLRENGHSKRDSHDSNSGNSNISQHEHESGSSKPSDLASPGISLRERLKQYEDITSKSQSIASDRSRTVATPARRMWGSPVVSVAETIRRASSNDPSLVSSNFFCEN